MLRRLMVFILLFQMSLVQIYAMDDTCTFMTTANDIPPNIVILLDNGAAMEEIIWHQGYYNSISYQPSLATLDVVRDQRAVNGSFGFLLEKGYSITISGGKYSLVDIPEDLIVAHHEYSLMADGTGRNPVWTINGRTITLPGTPSAAVDANGVKDNAANFRFSKNYLNWLFFSTGDGAYTGNGSDLPNVTRFYYAKKALMTVAKMTANQAQFSIYNFTSNANGSTNVQPLGMVVNTPLALLPENNTLNSSYVNNVNNMGTVTYSPLAEGLASIGGYYASPSSHVVGYYCQKIFALVVTPGMSSFDEEPAAGSSPSPSVFSVQSADYDNDNPIVVEGNIKEITGSDTYQYSIPTNLYGTTFLDDVACYMYKNDIVDYQDGFQNVRTYTLGFMGDHVSNLFLINTSNNGNGNFNLYDTSDPEYGKYHYVAEDPDELAAKLLSAVNDIIAQTNSFTAPVVPVTRTTSGDRIYLAFFKPDKSNFWEGNVTKFGLSESLEIVDKNGDAATYPNGAMIDAAIPYWQTKDWATPGKSNYIHNSERKIFTYLGTSKDLTQSANAFNSSNITTTQMGNPTVNPTNPDEQIIGYISYIRGADVFDQDKDGNVTENRTVITGDVLHSEPVVIPYGTESYAFFGSNDGMLHAVKDSTGKESWAFIPPDLLPKLKDMIEGVGHQYYVDASPKIYFKDIDKDGTVGSGDQVVLVCGERKGGSSYFALDITNPENPIYLWRIDNINNAIAPPDHIVAELGQSWSEPQFGLAKTSSTDTVGTPVFFIGAGYSSNNSSGKAILAINVLTGAVIKTFTDTDMDYSIASNVLVVDANDNGFIDKVYVGDLGSQLWRLGNLATSCGVGFDPVEFPDCENIGNWAAQKVFVADSLHTRKFYYTPSLVFEYNYDLLFIGTGDRENACTVSTTLDRFYCIKDTHVPNTGNLVDITTSSTLTDTSLDAVDCYGWYITLAAGEKALSENMVFYKIAYFTTFTPKIDPCIPGGEGRLYAMQYKTGSNGIDINNDQVKERSFVIGGGIPSKPVIVIPDTRVPPKMLISVGSTNPDAQSPAFGAGVVDVTPEIDIRYPYKWWREPTKF